jgi:DNA-binding HxlR family transcriptional regulator
MSPNNEELEPRLCEALREILGRVGDKWTIVILTALGDKRMRLKDLHRAIDGISQRMLIVTLRNLERDGLMVRLVHATVPPRVEYELSGLGRSLRGLLEPVGAWALANKTAIEESRQRFDGDAQASAARILTQK